jgi:hypothetical protein
MAYYARRRRDRRDIALASPLSGLRQSLRARPRAQRELLWLVVGAALGVLAVPPLVWLVGRLVLDAYANGGLLAFWMDFLRSLAQGSPAAWLLLAGPYAILMLLRLARLIVVVRDPARD